MLLVEFIIWLCLFGALQEFMKFEKFPSLRNQPLDSMKFWGLKFRYAIPLPL